jgi:hypothetical protein
MKSNITKMSAPDVSGKSASGHRKSSADSGSKSMLGTLILMLLFSIMSQIGFGQYSITAGQTYSQNFDSLPQSGNWATPAFWRIAGDAGVPNEGASGGYVDIPYSGANNGGTSYLPAYGSGNCASGGSLGWNCYRDSAHVANRSIGMRATPSTNQNASWYVQFTNTGTTYISSLTVSYEILKFMKSSSSNQAIQLFYSLDDNTYTKADTLQFTTISGTDGVNTCFSAHVAGSTDQGVGQIWNVTGTFYPSAPIAPGATFYLAWNYSELAINTTSKEALLALDSVYVTAHANPPSMCCPTATSITNSSAVLGATVVNMNGTTLNSRGVVYSTTNPVTISNNPTAEGGIIAGTYSESISSLTPQTHYWYAGYAYNAIGDSLSPQGNFFTQSNPPTSAASAFVANAASGSEIDLSWTVATFPVSGANNTGYLILVRSDATNPSTTGIVNATAPGSLSLPSGTTLLATITSGATTTYANTGLPGQSQYNYTIVPFTWDGTNAATYNYFTTGAPSANATTGSGTPTLSSPTVSTVTNNSATLGATVTNNGGFSLTDRGTVYNTNSSVTLSTNPLSDGGLTVGPYTSNRTGLNPQTQYWYAGYATNSAGSALSPISNFYTLSNPATTQASNMTTVPVANSTNDTVKWTAATFPSSGATTKGYVLLIAQSPNLPFLGSSNGQAPVAGPNSTIVSSTIASNAVSYFDNSGKTGLTVYNYLLVPFTWDGTHAATYNYVTVNAPLASVRTNAGNLYTDSIGTWNFTNPIWASNVNGPYNLSWVDSNYVVFAGTAADSLTVGANVKVQGISFLENSGAEYRICGPDTISMLGTTPTITLNGSVTANGVIDAAIKTSSPINVNFTGTSGTAICDFDYPNQTFTGGIIIQNGIGRVNINAAYAVGTGPIVVNANAMRFSNHNANNFPNDVAYPRNDNSGSDTIVIPNTIVLDSINVHPFSLSMGATNNSNLAFTDWQGVIRNSGTFTTADTVFLGNAPGLLTGGGAGHAQFSNHCTFGGITCNNSGTSAIFSNGIDDAFSPNSDYLFAPASGAWDFNGHNQRLRSLAGPGAGVSNSQPNLSTLTIQGSATTTFSGSLTGNIGITLSSTNTGTLTMNGFCSQTGNTVVSGGTLVLKTLPRNTLFSQSNLLVNGGTLKDSTQQEIGNVTLSSGTLLIAAGDTLYVDSTFTFSGGTLTVNGVLQINPSGKLLCGTNTVTGSGKFILTSGATLEMANPIGITSSGATGNIQTTGRSFSTGGNYIYNAASAQVTGNGLPTTVGGLTISNASGVTITNSVIVNGTLAFTAGTVTTGVNSVTVGSAGSVTGAGSSSFVNGNEIKNLANGTTAINFEIGNGSNYTPINLNFNGSGVTSASGSLLANSTNGNHAQMYNSMIDSLLTAARYWTLTATNLTFNTTYNATFNFVSSDLEVGAVPANFIGSEYNGGSWNQPTVGTRTGLSTQLTGITTFSDFQVGNPCTLPSITPNITNASSFCGNNGSINPTISGGTGSFAYIWSNGSTNLSISGLTAGTYTLSVTGNGGCTGSFTYTVTQPSAVVNVSGNLNTCPGGSTTLTASGMSTYTWSPATGLNTTTGSVVTCHLPSSSPITYTVTGTTGCGTTTTNITVTVGAPTFTDSYTNCLCYGDNTATITMNASNGSAPYTYTVTNMLNNSTINQAGNGHFTGLVSTRYKMSVTDNGGCTSALTIIITTQPSQVTFNYTSSNVSCNGSNNGSITLTAGGGTGVKTYTDNGGSSYQAGNVFSSLAPSTYTVNVKDANGCTASVRNISITQPAALSFTTSVVPSSCSSSTGEIIVYATGGSGVYNFSINGGSTYSSGYVFTNLAPNTYSVVVKDANGCTTSQNVVVSCSGSRMTVSTSATTSSFDVYPNPASEKTIVTFSSSNESNYTLRLFDMQGRMIQSIAGEAITGDNQIELNISELAQGIYLLIMDKDGITNKAKLIVQ